MASLDFVYDLTDKLEDEGITYVVVALQDGPTGDKVDVFYHVRSRGTKRSILAVLDRLKHDMTISDDEDDGQENGFDLGI
tara:strand:- start:344 stop:583 length:240 start_codon:yes stop_codon:yes gene_type:complete